MCTQSLQCMLIPIFLHLFKQSILCASSFNQSCTLVFSLNSATPRLFVLEPEDTCSLAEPEVEIIPAYISSSALGKLSA